VVGVRLAGAGDWRFGRCHCKNVLPSISR
jgi:hypothetical protein